MKKYDVTLTAHYRKTVSVYAESPEQAKEKTKIILFDTDLINFTDDDFVCGETDITEQREDGLDGAGENTPQENEDCSWLNVRQFSKKFGRQKFLKMAVLFVLLIVLHLMR